MRALLLALVVLAALPAAARADTVVALGDSAISGEAGRWAGNTNGAPRAPTRSARPPTTTRRARRGDPGLPPLQVGRGAHRRRREVSVNLACSGARTYSRISDGKFKPGIDFYTSGATRAKRWRSRSTRRHNNIKAVVVLIGANDYGFADIVETCVTNWLTSPSWWKNYCQDDASMPRCSRRRTSPRSPRVRNAFQNVKQAMDAAPATRRASTSSSRRRTRRRSRAPAASATAETGFTRQTIGGCGVWNSDANWARDTVVNTLNNTISNAVAALGTCRCSTWPTRSRPQAVREHRRAARGEGRRELAEPGAADKTEWVHQIRTLTTLFPPYQLQEDGHPNYWGQLALRNCFRQAYTAARPRRDVLARHRAQRQRRAEHEAAAVGIRSGDVRRRIAAPCRAPRRRAASRRRGATLRVGSMTLHCCGRRGAGRSCGRSTPRSRRLAGSTSPSAGTAARAPPGRRWSPSRAARATRRPAAASSTAGSSGRCCASAACCSSTTAARATRR